jgi:hypothetical protein
MSIGLCILCQRRFRKVGSLLCPYCLAFTVTGGPVDPQSERVLDTMKEGFENSVDARKDCLSADRVVELRSKGYIGGS